MEDPRCEYSIGGGWTIVQRAVWSESVVFFAPPFDKHLGLPEVIEDLPVE
jgi:hypothetical protein